MRIGYYCESPVDRAALRIFTEGILGRPPEPINLDLEARSVPGFFSALDGVYRGVHYTSDAEGLVLVVDADHTEFHDFSHDLSSGGAEGCRFCQIRKIITQAQKQLKPRQGRPELRVAIGVCLPAMEAWYLAGKNHQVGEAAWRATGRPPFTAAQLKKLVYGKGRPSLEVQTECAVREARRIIRNLQVIEDAFPIGFGLMAKEIRAWSARSG